MYRKACNILLISLFMLMLFLPFILSDKEGGKISAAERRFLGKAPVFKTEDGWNTSWNSDTESWLSDNMGFRLPLIELNAKINYRIFHKLSSGGYMPGKNNSLQYLSFDMLETYIHSNLYTPEQVKEVADSYQTISDWLGERGIPFYYIQCWNKSSIEEEQMPDSLVPVGEFSRTDQVIQALEESTTVQVIPLKEFLLEKNKEYSTYGNWSDPTHWTPRAAHDAYLHIMERLSREQGGFPILEDEDFEIKNEDIGEIVATCIHEEDVQKTYEVKDPKAVNAPPEETGIWGGDERHRFFRNDTVENPKKVLIIGDSYLYGYIIEELGESFSSLDFIWADYLEDMEAAVDFYKPDLVIYECAERMYRDKLVVNLAEKLRK